MPSLVTKSIREVKSKPKNDVSNDIAPKNPELDYYANLYDSKDDIIDTAREVLTKIDKNREKGERDRAK
jgi:hypothetical protein